ncbi:uncharacterized protein LOC129568319 [Sitodiplosis mosellana]|uniref:uncharacterized protein LOC129568319 n=1 Tax=Sitodiplosis mosellana TaxID=263140 RepID=UPI0024438054|nr:uncharacterized protein LOC129568319 [Sitodiplosis mosellana]
MYIVFIVLLSVFVFVFSDLLDGVGTFSFNKSNNKSGEYDFEYRLENGELFDGKTISLNGCDTNVHIMFGADNSIFWVRLSEEEFQTNSIIRKIVRRVERIKNTEIRFKDDLIEYTVTNYSSSWKEDSLVQKVPYLTKWDFENICFTKQDEANKIFLFEIRSKNNPRLYNGTTIWEDGNPRLQKIYLKDLQIYDAKYEIELTENVLNSNATFCKGISRTVWEYGVLGACAARVKNPKLMEELMRTTQMK